MTAIPASLTAQELNELQPKEFCCVLRMIGSYGGICVSNTKLRSYINHTVDLKTVQVATKTYAEACKIAYCEELLHATFSKSNYWHLSINVKGGELFLRPWSVLDEKGLIDQDEADVVDKKEPIDQENPVDQEKPVDQGKFERFRSLMCCFR